MSQQESHMVAESEDKEPSAQKYSRGEDVETTTTPDLQSEKIQSEANRRRRSSRLKIALPSLLRQKAARSPKVIESVIGAARMVTQRIGALTTLTTSALI